MEGEAGKQREQQCMQRHEDSWTVARVEAGEGGQSRECKCGKATAGWGRGWKRGCACSADEGRPALWVILDGVYRRLWKTVQKWTWH